MGISYPDPPEEGAYLAVALAELGWCGDNGFGEIALPWSEIKAYAEVTATLSEPWEFRCVRKMSLNYCIERRNDSLLRIAPYDREN